MSSKVHFNSSPVESIFRPPTTDEYWAIYSYNTHIESCNICVCPCHIFVNQQILCPLGSLLQEHLLKWIRVDHNHRAYSTEADAYINIIEIPLRFNAVHGLLKLKYQEKFSCLCGSVTEEEITLRKRQPYISGTECILKSGFYDPDRDRFCSRRKSLKKWFKRMHASFDWKLSRL